MTTNPSDFSSYSAGVLLNSANYSGGAGGTFTDLVTGNEDWTVVSATPTFNTVGGLEGMTFANSATESVLREIYEFRQITFVALGYAGNTASQLLIGGTNAASNTFGMFFNGNRLQAYLNTVSSGWTASTVTAGNPYTYAVSWNPQTGGMFATAYIGSTVKANATASPKRLACANDFQMAVGRHRTTYLTGWVEEVHIFSRCLHEDDETGLDDMLATLYAQLS